MNTPSLATLCPASIRLARRSVTFTTDTTEQDLETFESLILEAGDVSPFAWGDYLNHLAHTRGDEFARAKAASRFAPKTSRNMQWVCRHVDPARRREELTFAHHAEVANLTPTDQEIMLTEAEENDWPVTELRAAVRKSRQTISDGGEKTVDRRASAASRAFEEFSLWFFAQYPGMSVDTSEAWHNSLRPIIGQIMAGMDQTERALYVQSAIEEAQIIALVP